MNNSINMADYQRVKNNLAAIRDFKGGDVSAARRYTGWGGLREAIYTKSVFVTLKKELGLSDEEILNIKRTLRSAYFTPSFMVKGLWQLVEVFSDAPINCILEPSVGTGAFLRSMPKSLADTALIDAVELDPLTARMCQAGFPRANVLAQGFETFSGREGGYDLVIGNPPFGKQKLVDSKHEDLGEFCIHHYFVAKSFRLLKVGGLLAMVLPSFFLDNKTKHVRDIVAREGGKLMAAFRLPSDCFDDAKVTVDLVVIKKFDSPQDNSSWGKSVRWSLGDKADFMNPYFANHPECVLGKLAIVPMYNRFGIECQRTREPQILLDEAIAKLTPPARLDSLFSLDAEIENLQKSLKKMQMKLQHLEGLKAQFLAVRSSIKAAVGGFG